MFCAAGAGASALCPFGGPELRLDKRVEAFFGTHDCVSEAQSFAGELRQVRARPAVQPEIRHSRPDAGHVSQSRPDSGHVSQSRPDSGYISQSRQDSSTHKPVKASFWT